jgi:hypothetical protein
MKFGRHKTDQMTVSKPLFSISRPVAIEYWQFSRYKQQVVYKQSNRFEFLLFTYVIDKGVQNVQGQSQTRQCQQQPTSPIEPSYIFISIYNTRAPSRRPINSSPCWQETRKQLHSHLFVCFFFVFLFFNTRRRTHISWYHVVWPAPSQQVHLLVGTPYNEALNLTDPPGINNIKHFCPERNIRN